MLFVLEVVGVGCDRHAENGFLLCKNPWPQSIIIVILITSPSTGSPASALGSLLYGFHSNMERDPWPVIWWSLLGALFIGGWGKAVQSAALASCGS